MKRTFVALLATVVMLAVCVPALAFTGFDADPGLPVVESAESPLFSVNVGRVENDPIVTEDDFGDETYTWTEMAADAAIAAGDVVTLSCEIVVPDAIDGCTEEQLEAIETLFTISGLEELELVRASGCDANFECDFELGFCYPLPGYGNARLNGNVLEVEPHLGSNIQIIVRGTATAANVKVSAQSSIGQYSVPTHFSCGKLTKAKTDMGTEYYVYFKDTFNVQLRGMKFYAVDGVYSDSLVHYNNHDYRLNEEGFVEVVDGVEVGDIITSGDDRFDILTSAYAEFMGFFGFTDDGVADVLTDGVFLNGCNVSRFNDDFILGEVVSDDPVQPTPEPSTPTTPPTPPTPPETGAISIAVIGVIAVLGGIGGAIALRKKEN